MGNGTAGLAIQNNFALLTSLAAAFNGGTYSLASSFTSQQMTHDFRDKEASTITSFWLSQDRTHYSGRARASSRPRSAKNKLPREAGEH